MEERTMSFQAVHQSIGEIANKLGKVLFHSHISGNAIIKLTKKTAASAVRIIPIFVKTEVDWSLWYTRFLKLIFLLLGLGKCVNYLTISVTVTNAIALCIDHTCIKVLGLGINIRDNISINNLLAFPGFIRLYSFSIIFGFHVD